MQYIFPPLFFQNIFPMFASMPANFQPNPPARSQAMNFCLCPTLLLPLLLQNWHTQRLKKKFFRAYFFFLFFLDTQNQHFFMKIFHHLFAQSLPRFFTTFPVPYVLANKNFCLRKIFSFLWMFKILQNNFSWPSRKIPPFHMPVSPRPLDLFR